MALVWNGEARRLQAGMRGARRLQASDHDAVPGCQTVGFGELMELEDFKFSLGLRELGCSRMGRRQLSG